jgi:hypothetical protein
MATLAAFFRRPDAAVLAGARECYNEQPDVYRLRPLPCEDVYFFTKRIDNSRVVREADPLARRKCWRAVSLSMLAAAVVMVLMLPDALGMMAGYQLHSLERQRDQLAREKASLELQEATLLSPQRLQELARELRLVDPEPNHVVYLNPNTDSAVALNVPAK